MNKVFLGIAVMVLLASCHGNAVKDEKNDNADSLAQNADSLDLFDDDDDALPHGVDELFDDFIFNFASNKRMQLQRVNFPLPYITDGKRKEITREQWQSKPLFLHHDYYLVLFDNEEQMEFEKDTTLSKVAVEWLYLDKMRVEQFNFARTAGVWKLQNIDVHAMTAADNAEFFSFYHTFVTDSLYQREHVAEPLRFVTTDEDNDFETIEGTVDIDQWFLFRPELPTETVASVNYGQPNTDNAHKVLVKKGVSNGMYDILTFRKLSEQWMLVSYEN